MVSDSANAAYMDEQIKREQMQDDRARAWEAAVHSLKEQIEHWGIPALRAALSLLSEQYSVQATPSVTCPQCENWQAERQLHLVDGSIRTSPGFCTARANADLPQMSQEYAQQCRLFEPYIPF